MKTGRDKKVAEEIRREASQVVSFELQHPNIFGVTVTGVKLTKDLQLARIYFALPSGEKRRAEVEAALKKSSPFIRRTIAERIRIKYMPQLEFFYDESFELGAKIEQIFQGLESSEEDQERSQE